MVEVDTIWSLLEEVYDPEVPVLSVVDLGIVREVRTAEGAEGAEGRGGLEIVITPTYSGCPAMDVIQATIRMKLLEHGFSDVRLTTVLSPAWTTDWMSERGKERLAQFGIAPPLPLQQVCHPAWFRREEAIECPHCHSYNTTLISEFGSTACKSLYRCEDCREPFDYFKCH